jgi:hypothetical protein
MFLPEKSPLATISGLTVGIIPTGGNSGKIFVILTK